MSDRVQEERRWTPADRLEMKLDQALAERDRWAEVAEGLAEALRDLDRPDVSDEILARYEALRDG